MRKLIKKPIILIVLSLVLLVTVLVIARTLEGRNRVTPPTGHSSSTQTSAPGSSSQTQPTSMPATNDSDLIEGSMGLGDNPFND